MVHFNRIRFALIVFFVVQLFCSISAIGDYNYGEPQKNTGDPDYEQIHYEVACFIDNFTEKSALMESQYTHNELEPAMWKAEDLKLMSDSYYNKLDSIHVSSDYKQFKAESLVLMKKGGDYAESIRAVCQYEKDGDSSNLEKYTQLMEKAGSEHTIQLDKVIAIDNSLYQDAVEESHQEDAVKKSHQEDAVKKPSYNIIDKILDIGFFGWLFIACLLGALYGLFFVR